MSAPTAPNIVLRPEPSGPTSLTFYWSAPTSDGGSPITKYTLACSAISYSQDISANQDIFTVSSGLVAGNEYTFTMTATNANGTSPAATYRTMQIGTIPFGPTTVTASTLTSTIAYLTWDLSTVVASASAPKWFVVTVQPSTVGLSSFKRCAYVFERAKTFTLPSTNIFYRFLVQSVSDSGYCPPFAYTSSLGFGITGAGAFSPSSITGLQAWYDGADPLGTGTAPASGTNITSWADKSGNNR